MKTKYILIALIIFAFTSCNVETYLSKEFTVGNDYSFPIRSDANIKLHGRKCWIDGVKIPNYQLTDTSVIFRCSGTEINFIITK